MFFSYKKSCYLSFILAFNEKAAFSAQPSEAIYTYFACLYPINAKTAKPIGPKFCVGPPITPGDAQNKKKLSPKIFYFRKIQNIYKLFFKSSNFYFTVLSKRKGKIEHQLKIKIEDGREVP